MEDNTLIDRLVLFGMTRQQASIYLCLASNRELSGYEVSKLTGISRSNVYNALASLVEDGAVFLLEGSTNKYTAVDVAEFCQSKIRHMQQVKEELIRDMPRVGNTSEGYITIVGYKNIADRIHSMLASVQYRIYISMPMKFLKIFEDDIKKLLEENKKVVLLVKEEVVFSGAIIYITEKEEQQLRLIVDSEYVLTGDMTGSGTDTCLYCGQKNFVNVFKESMKNEIKLIEITRKEKENE